MSEFYEDSERLPVAPVIVTPFISFPYMVTL